MIPAARTLEVLVDQPPPAKASMISMMLGPLGRNPPRAEVLVVDRASRKLVMRVPVDGPAAEAEADAIAAIFRADLETLDERGFLKRHGRAHRHR